MPVRPEMIGASIVAVGNFNPLIFRPDWFVQKGILAREEVEQAVKDKTITIIHPDIVEFVVPSFGIVVERERLQVERRIEPLIPLFDLVYGTFSELPETPVLQMGINRSGHYPVGSAEKLSALGDLLAPRGPWASLVTGEDGARVGGLSSMTMERSSRHDDRRGVVRVTVEPSRRIPNAVYLRVNDHYDLGDEPLVPVRAEDAKETLKDIFDSSMKYSADIMERIVMLANA